MRKAKFFYRDPNAPKPNKPNHIGVNAIITYKGKLLLEKRADSSKWRLIGGGLKIDESLEQGLCREIWEETGILIQKATIQFYKIYDDPSRIASYPDGNIFRILSIVYQIELSEKPDLKCSEESIDLKFFERRELAKVDFVKSHQMIIKDILEDILVE